ncbi:hypothetical protein MHBO_003649 [Bonamia ostreae]|uniref:Uncharacterized protein n=1 Tax=Bonamia ostreae TaxID=126728 RepID=A0ABV2ARQ9_9EUKA
MFKFYIHIDIKDYTGTLDVAKKDKCDEAEVVLWNVPGKKTKYGPVHVRISHGLINEEICEVGALFNCGLRNHHIKLSSDRHVLVMPYHFSFVSRGTVCDIYWNMKGACVIVCLYCSAFVTVN